MIGGFDADSKNHKVLITGPSLKSAKSMGGGRVPLKQPLRVFSHHPLEGVIFFVLL